MQARQPALMTFVPKRAGKRACHASHAMASETTGNQKARQRGNDQEWIDIFYPCLKF